MLSPGWRELIIYLTAGAIYVALSVFFPEAILSVFEGIAFLLVMVWLIPLIVRVLR